MNQALGLLQKFVAADKAAVTSALIGALSLLCVHLGLKLNASDMTYVAIGVSTVVGLFVHAHFTVAKAQQKAAAEPPK